MRGQQIELKFSALVVSVRLRLSLTHVIVRGYGKILAVGLLII